MYPRAKVGDCQRASRPRKRRHYERKCHEPGKSISRKKLALAKSHISVNSGIRYRIIEFGTVFHVLSQFSICIECKEKLKFQDASHRGFGFKILVSCKCAGREISSSPHVGNAFEVNRRIVFVMRLLGIGLSGLNLFSGIMDFGPGLSNTGYEGVFSHIHSAASRIFEQSAKSAVQQEQEETVKKGGKRDELAVSGDGSWKRRGFSSLYGVATLIGSISGKVIDLVIKSSFCKSCTQWSCKEGTPEFEKWQENHAEDCAKNHSGSAGKMEVDGIKEMFCRSITKFKCKYMQYIGDGDSKTYKAVLDANPYGSDFQVEKKECVGHVEKRMGTRLRNLKKKEKLNGKGSLTGELIKKLTIYYGLAIRRNSESVESMKKSIFATLGHYCSTDKRPRHENCPVGPDSWCKYRQAQMNQEGYVHPPPAISPQLEKHLLPIYEALTNDELLKRCLGGHTQNANESFNGTIWRLTPKHLNAGRKVVELAAFLAAIIFNDGYTLILRVMQEIGVNIGTEAKSFAHRTDGQRCERGDQRWLETTKEARTATRLARLRQNQLYEDSETPMYGPGIDCDSD